MPNTDPMEFRLIKKKSRIIGMTATEGELQHILRITNSNVEYIGTQNKSTKDTVALTLTQMTRICIEANKFLNRLRRAPKRTNHRRGAKRMRSILNRLFYQRSLPFTKPQ